jgi:hypothetical protein
LFLLEIYLYTDLIFIKIKLKLPKKMFGLISNDDNWVDLDTYHDLELLKFHIKTLKKL